MSSFRVQTESAIYATPIVQNLLQDFSLVEDFYEYDPMQADSYVRRAHTVAKTFKGDRKVLVEELIRYNRLIGADEKAIVSAETLLDSTSVALITGQQASIAAGPLYIIHKAITVLRKAKAESERLNCPVVPVFWVAAEDHDYQEVQSLSLVTKEGVLQKLNLSYSPEIRSSVGHIKVPQEAVEKLLAQLQESLQDTEFKDEILGEFYAAWERTDNMADWFAAFLAFLFRGTGLLFVNAMTPALRQLVKGRFAEVLSDVRRYISAVEKGAEELRGKGYPVQVEIMKNSTLLFIEHEGARMALEVSSDGHTFSIRGTDVKFTKSELLDLVNREPERFSPNVLLRPLIQDTLFPTLGYVGGAAEISYHALIKRVFDTAGEQMSILIPRFQVTIVEKAQERLLEKYHFHPRDFLSRSPKPVDQVLKKADTLGVDDRFEELKKGLQEQLEALTVELQTLDPGAQQLGQEAMTAMLHRLDQFQGKTKQLFRKRHDTIIKQFERVESALAPRGHLQERELNILSYIVKYGPAFVTDLLESIGDHGFGRMTDVYL